MLLYIIWSVFQAVQLVFHDTITTLDLSKIPSAEEKYLIHKALIPYIKNSLIKSSKFTALKTLIAEKTQQRRNEELADIEVLKKEKKSVIPSWLYYIPIVNII